MADSKKYNGSTWEHSLRKLTTATDTITTLPAVLYPNDTTATVGLKGNTVQNGTPTPDNPIMPQGTGEKTNNLLRLYKDSYALDENGNEVVNSDFCIYEATVDSNSLNYILSCGTPYGRNVRVHEYNGSMWVSQIYVGMATTLPFDLTKSSGTNVIRVSAYKLIPNMMLAYGSTPLPYEPYGIKIPILSNSTTTPVYLGEVETTRRVKKKVLTGEENITSGHLDVGLFNIPVDDYIREPIISSICTHYKAQSNVESWDMVLNKNICFYVGVSVEFRQLYIRDSSYPTVADFKSYLAAQYTAGTPITIWYVLAAPETAVVNEPLMKIGDYADTVSGITVPTITGADSFDVETTLKPSEVSLNYTGWHDASVKEKSENLFDYKTAYAQYLSGDDVVITPLQMLSERQYFTSDEVGTTITISVYAKTVTSTRVFIRANINGVNVDSNSVLGGNSGVMVVTVTPKSTSNYFILTYGDSGGYNTFNQFMLNTGSTALPYEPYWK